MFSDNKEQFLRALSASIADGSFVKLTLGKYRGVEAGLKNLIVRLVEIKSADHLSFLFRYQTKDITKNHRVAEGLELLGKLLGTEFLSAHLFTTARDLQIEWSKKLKTRLTVSQPTFAAPPAKIHDREKRRVIALAGNVYLRALDITNERGEVRAGKNDKWRQINKFIEIIENLYDASPLAAVEREISVVDMGSGKGYLTFAVYDYFNNIRERSARVRGVEARDELVALSNGVAREAGFDKLHFERGLIRDYEIIQADILIALHACNTATDEALDKGIKAGASIIICAPCCHQQLRPQMVAPEVLRGVLRHGILLEREAETVTDGIRALLLERSGYATKVFEFISTEHTQKNTLIVGVKHEWEIDAASITRQVNSLKEFYGIREHYLEKLLAAT